MLDKTGTLTEGAIEFQRIHELAADGDPIHEALGALARRHPSQRHDGGDRRLVSGAGGMGARRERPVLVGAEVERGAFGDHGTWVIGAPEMVWDGAER